MAADREGFKPQEAVVVFFELEKDAGGGIWRYNVLADTHRPVKGVDGPDPMANFNYEKSTLTGRQIPWVFLGDKLTNLDSVGTRAANS